MKPNTDDDLSAIFAHARRCDHEDAPVWRPELLAAPRQRPRLVLRWAPAALAAACVVAWVVFLAVPRQHHTPLSEALPPLFDSPPGELFASLDPPLLAFESPSDILLTPHLNPSIP
jgi:hypothetical protein